MKNLKEFLAENVNSHSTSSINENRNINKYISSHVDMFSNFMASNGVKLGNYKVSYYGEGEELSIGYYDKRGEWHPAGAVYEIEFSGGGALDLSQFSMYAFKDPINNKVVFNMGYDGYALNPDGLNTVNDYENESHNWDVDDFLDQRKIKTVARELKKHAR